MNQVHQSILMLTYIAHNHLRLGTAPLPFLPLTFLGGRTGDSSSEIISSSAYCVGEIVREFRISSKSSGEISSACTRAETTGAESLGPEPPAATTPSEDPLEEGPASSSPWGTISVLTTLKNGHPSNNVNVGAAAVCQSRNQTYKAHARDCLRHWDLGVIATFISAGGYT